MSTLARLAAVVVMDMSTSFRESLPHDDREAGVFISGMAWMFVIFIVCAVLVTIAYAKAHGLAL